MPSWNEIVPLDASEGEARLGPEAVTLPSAPPQKPKLPVFGSKPKATSAEMATVQEQRMTLVRAQQRHIAFQLFYGLFGVALMMVQVEYLWFANTQKLPDTCPVEATTQCPLCFQALGTSVPVKEGHMILLALRILITFSTALMLYYIYLYYAAECEVMKLKNIIPPKATLLGSSLRRSLLLEMLILGVHPFPGIEDVDPKWPQLTVAASLLMFVRVTLVVRVAQFRNSFNSSNGWFISALTNVDFTATFFMKSTLKNHPSRCLITSFATLGFVAGYSLYVSERFLCAYKRNSCCQPMLLGDALWMLIITILTIGYGDVVPRTTLGRAIAVSAGVFGTLSTAVTIAVMSNYLVLTRSEHKVNAFLKKDENRRLINDHAARALQAFVQLLAAQRRHHHAAATTDGRENGSLSVTATKILPDNTGKQLTGTHGTKRALHRAELKLFTVLSKYRQVKRRVYSHDVSDPIDSQITMLEMLEVNVEYIRTKVEELSEFFLAQTGDRSRNMCKLSNIATASITEPPADVQSINGGDPTSDSVTLLQRSHPRILQQSSQFRHQPPILSTVQANVSSPHTSLVSEACIGASTAQAAPPAPENIPAWALALELTLQSLLEQVAHVSNEVDAMKARVQFQSECIEGRVLNLEKRLVMSDALHEMAMRGSSRNLLRQESKSSDDGSAAGSTSSPPRLRRSMLQQPTIHNFVAPSELLEYQKSNEEHDEG